VWVDDVIAHPQGDQRFVGLEFAASKRWRFVRGLFPRFRPA